MAGEVIAMSNTETTGPATAGAPTTAGVQPPAAAAQPSPAVTRPSRRAIATRILLLVGIALVVFVGILPRVVDYDAVRAALSSLSTTQLAVLVVVTWSPTSRMPRRAVS